MTDVDKTRPDVECAIFAELALMQTANNVTIAALRYVHGRLERGMNAADIGALMNGVTTALGGSPEFALVLLNEASAYPHGSLQSQSVDEGSVVLMDCGCTVQGYQSDISRTWVFGEPSTRQRLADRKNRHCGGRY